MIFRKNRDINYVPPVVLKESNKIIAGPTKIIGMILVFSVIILRNYSSSLGSLIPFGNYLWIIPIALFLGYVIKVSSKINRPLKERGTNIAEEYNKYGDASLFDYASKGGTLKLFDPKKIILMFMIIPFTCFCLMFGILALQLVIFKEIKQFLPLGIIAIVVSTGVPFLFLFEDRRILNEARRRSQFVDMAQKRWRLSKIIYIAMILIAVMSAFLLIQNNANFLEKGVVTENGKVIYDGR